MFGYQNRGKSLIVCIIIVLFWISCVFGQDNEERFFKVGGLMFGDLYHVVSHHLDRGNGATGLVIRRGYLTSDFNFSESWFGRLRFELNQAGKFETYTFDVQFKDLYAGWNLGEHRILFGLGPTITYDLIESVWGMRYLVRTPMDLQGVASRDVGISAKGPLITSANLSYRAMVGSGLEFGAESGDGRKWMGALTWKPGSNWIFDLYVDYERLVGPTDRTTFQFFVSYQTDLLRCGFQYSHQDRQEDPRLELMSIFVVSEISEKISLVGRVDRIIGPSPAGDNISYLPFDPTAPATFFIGGVEYRIDEYLFITPNSVITVYDRNAEGIMPKTDLHLRLTFFLNLE